MGGGGDLAKVRELEAPVEVEIKVGDFFLKLRRNEVKLFDLLLSFLRSRKWSHIDIRVAGGWVRDKLLGRGECNDLDLVVSELTGYTFATTFREWLLEHHEHPSDVGIIKANPERSKHLETAMMSLFGLDMDFVHLRTESYAEGSRIPEVKFGTPAEDAFRRDFTVNALFYNIKRGIVEDFTGKGVEDLHARILRTPIEARVTFCDDPLRFLRGARFVASLGFTPTPAILTVVSDVIFQRALATAVSRERIRKEILLMTEAEAVDEGFAILAKDAAVASIVFDVKGPARELSWACAGVGNIRRLKLLMAATPLPSDSRTPLILAAFLAPLKDYPSPIVQKYGKNGALNNLASYCCTEGLKLPKRISERVAKVQRVCSWWSIVASGEENFAYWQQELGLMEEFRHSRRTLLGLIVRGSDEQWLPALLLSKVLFKDLTKSLAGLEEELMEARMHAFVEEAPRVIPKFNGHVIMQLFPSLPKHRIKDYIDFEIQLALSETTSPSEGEVKRRLNVFHERVMTSIKTNSEKNQKP